MMHLVDSARGALKLYATAPGATQQPYQRTKRRPCRQDASPRLDLLHSSDSALAEA